DARRRRGDRPLRQRRRARLLVAGGLRALGDRGPRALSGVPVVRGRQATQPRGLDELPVTRPAHGLVAAIVLSACWRQRAAAACARQRATTAPAPDFHAAVSAAAGRIAEASARTGGTGWTQLTELADDYGNRITGSETLTAVLGWATQRMRDDGLENVRLQPVAVPHWVRGTERARIVEPVDRPMAMLRLRGSRGT